MPFQLLTFGDRWRLGVIAASATIFGLFAPLTAMAVDWSTLIPVYLMAALLTGVAVAYRFLGRDEGIAVTVFVVAQIVVYSNVAVLDNYLGLELRRPLYDVYLAGADRALGIDWWAYVVWVKSTPVLGPLLTVAYQSSLPQVAVAIIVLGFTKRFDRLDRFTLAFMFSSAATIAIWAAFPTMGALTLHVSQGLPDPTFGLAVTKEEALKLLALHAGPTPIVRLENITGLIACPSFHTALAILTVYALWGIRYAGTIAALWNVFVLASIPADGGHHFIDLAGGAAVTFLGLYFAGAALQRKERSELAIAQAQTSLAQRLPA
jgi:hypothetical protein